MKVLFVFNSIDFYSKFAYEIVCEFASLGHNTVVVVPKGEKILVENKSIEYEYTNIDRRGKNIFKDFSLFKEYKKIIKKHNPHLIFTFTIKPNIYISLITKKMNIPVIPRVSGLGSSFYKKDLVYFLTKFLYKRAFKNTKEVLFENEDIANLFNQNIMKLRKYHVISGSGVNITRFDYIDYPKDDGVTRFIFIGRIMKEKGIDEFLYASKRLKDEYGKRVEIHIVGDYEENYQLLINQFVKEDLIIYHGYVDDVIGILKNMNVTVLPSYHEGMSNVMLESQAIGRPVIGTNIPGIKETMIEIKSGFLCEPKSGESLYNIMKKFVDIPWNQKREMGIQGRKYIRDKFDRNEIVKVYLSYLEGID